jgi:UDP-N-acetylglucosamine 4,6-dehydratase/5-epimerase
VMTNILGSNNVIESAIAHEVQRVVCLGTDKAAYPINVMGMTKALMEKLAQAPARLGGRSSTVVATVRYGNVLASRGSVIPLFLNQIAAGGPITITEPSMTRFLLPLPSAIDLVLFAMEHARPGDLFIRKSPASTVGDMSAALQHITGQETEERIIGIRHGEKLFETLVSREELARSEDLGDYFRISIDERDLNYASYFTEGGLQTTALEDYTSHSTRRLSVDETVEVLMTVPEVRAVSRA